jgi:hypothetical protein
LTVAGAALSIMLVSACSTGGDPSPESTTDSAATNLDVAVATNEPWGTYHLDDVLPTAQDRDVTVTLVIPDEAPADDALDEDSPVPTLPLSQAQDEDFDLLVVNGATEWPGEVARSLDDVPLMASSTAYMNPERGEAADRLGDRITAATAPSPTAAETFASHMGIDEDEVQVVGMPELDALPAWQPRERTVAVLTSVTHPDETGAAAPGGELLLDISEQLDAQGWDVTVGLHPREDPQLWDDYAIDEEGSVHAATTASAVVGIPGSVFPEIAALGVPIVGVEDDGLDVPDYLTDLAVGVSDADEGVEAVEELAEAGGPHDAEAVDAATGPVGGAAGRLVDAWEAGAQQPQP